MNKMMIRAAILTAALIVLVPLGLRAQDEGYYPYSYARLSYVNGAVYVQRTSDLGYEKGEVNLALVQGDTLGTESGRAEVQFGRRNYLRLGDDTKVMFALLPTSGDERIGLHLNAGSLYLRVATLAADKGIEIDTPDASFYVLQEGLYRIDVRPEGDTQAFVREGSLEAAGEQGSKLVQAQESVTAADGQLLGDPAYAAAGADAFDDWNGGRDELLAARSERQYLPSDIDEYEEELDQNGHWVYERPYGNVWVPDVSYYDDWRPYYYGRWVWYPVIGWTWVGSEPWGWAVYHYGRWNWRFGLGWYWIPRAHWGPAWVHWWWDRDYIGWCPLTWYNRPAYLFQDRFYDRWDNRWFSARNRAMTVVRRDRLQDPDIGRRHLGGADLDRIGRVELRAQQPSIRPVVDNARPQAIAARRALADRPGVRNGVRTLAPSQAVSSSALRPRGVDQGLRPATRSATSRPALRGGEAGGRTIRTYPGGRVSTPGNAGQAARDRGGITTYPSRRNDGGSVSRSSEARVTRPQGQSGASSRGATVREQPRGRTSSGDRGGSVKSYPSTTRTVRSGSQGSSSSSAGRSQSRVSSSRSSVARSSSRLSSPRVSSAGPSSSISRSRSSSSFSSSSSSRNRSSYSPGARSSSSRTSVSRSRSSASSGRSFSAPRSSRSSSGRSSVSSRSSGSSGRSSRSSSSGRSSSSSSRSSRSSGSSSRSSGSRRK